MTTYKVKFKNSPKNDLRKIKQSNLRDKFDELIKKLVTNPYDPTDNFEKLMPPEDRFYSRRINIKHRLVYKVDEEKRVVYIYSAWNHYLDN